MRTACANVRHLPGLPVHWGDDGGERQAKHNRTGMTWLDAAHQHSCCTEHG